MFTSMLFDSKSVLKFITSPYVLSVECKHDLMSCWTIINVEATENKEY